METVEHIFWTNTLSIHEGWITNIMTTNRITNIHEGWIKNIMKNEDNIYFAAPVLKVYVVSWSFPLNSSNCEKKYISMNISRSVIPIFIKHIDKDSNLVLSDNEVVILFCSAHRTVAFDHCRERKCKNKTKLGDAICISNLKLSMTH